MNHQKKTTNQIRPSWLKKRIPSESEFKNISLMLNKNKIPLENALNVENQWWYEYLSRKNDLSGAPVFQIVKTLILSRNKEELFLLTGYVVNAMLLL